MWRDRSVIVVEDDEGVRTVLQWALAGELGAYATVAHDGAEALKWAQRLLPTLLILDLGLPTIDGFEVARRLKADPATRRIRIVAISAMVPVGDARERALAAGCDAFVPKPFQVDALLDVVHHQLLAAERDEPR